MKYLIILAVLSLAVPAAANGPFTISGKWAGTAFAAPIDLNGDGVNARTGYLPAYGQLAFTQLEGVLDTGLVALPGQGSCSDPNALELKPFGTVTFRGRQDNALFTTVDPAAPDLCFDPASPSEIVLLKIIGGTGIYANATGSVTMNFHDTVLVTRPVTINGVTLQAPLMDDTRGEFTVTIQ